MFESVNAEPAAIAQTRSSFFVVFASLMLLLVVAGFTRTYYLRPIFSTEPLPLYIHVHGVVLTAWFVLFLIQSMLIRHRRPHIHRRFGFAGVVIGAAVFAISSFTAINVYPLSAALGFDIDLTGSARLAQMTRDFVLLSAFPVFIVLAVVFRRRSEAHKRLMLLASISLLPAAVGRIFRWPALTDIPEAPATFAVIIALIVSVVIYDLATRKHFHPVVAWGAPLYLLWVIGGAVFVQFVIA